MMDSQMALPSPCPPLQAFKFIDFTHASDCEKIHDDSVLYDLTQPLKAVSALRGIDSFGIQEYPHN